MDQDSRWWKRNVGKEDAKSCVFEIEVRGLYRSTNAAVLRLGALFSSKNFTFKNLKLMGLVSLHYTQLRVQA